MSIILTFCIALILLLTASAAESTAAEDTATPAHGRLKDGGYNIYCLSGQYVTVDVYASKRSVELTFPDTKLKTFYVENKGNDQITLKVEDSTSSSGYSYVGIDASIKNGVALKLVDSPYLWNTYAESDTDLVFSLRPPANTKMLANASGEKSTPRTPIILWSSSDLNAPKHGEFRFEPVAASAKTPVATDYSFANLTQTEGSVTAVKIEGSGQSSPGKVTVLYNGSTTLPKKAGSYSITINVAAASPAWNAATGLKCGTLVIAPKPSTAAPVGQTIKMGGINWRVLDVQDGKALVLSELILDERSFKENNALKNAWADSALRTYLNGDFYNKTFTKNEKKRIVTTTLVNNINPQFSTTTGIDTKDKVFLLSAEEVARYFKDEKACIAYGDRRTPALLSSYMNNLAANPYEGVYQYYTPWYWWLRTPEQSGNGDRKALYVTLYGKVYAEDIDQELGVRPAMWIKVEGGGFTKYQPLKFNNPKYFTMDDMVVAIASDIVHTYTGDWVFRFGFGARGPAVTKTEAANGDSIGIPPGYAHWFYVFRMRCWGVLSLDDFNPNKKVTYGQFKDYLMKTMDWFKKYGADNSSNYTFTKEILAIAVKKAGISNTKANAVPVKEEIKRLSKEIRYWLEAANAGNSGVRLLEFPTKTEYKVGEGFDITGLLVVTGPYGKETNVNDELTITTNGVTLKAGRPFQTTGQKTIEISYKGQKLGAYPITVK